MMMVVGRLPCRASLLSAVLSFVGYQSFALILTYKDRFEVAFDDRDRDPYSDPYLDSDNTSGGSSPLPFLLALSYFCLGGAAIGAYFSSLTTAALQFPRYPTLALSLPLSCYGLSSLTLSSIARSRFFLDHSSQLDPIRLTRFLGVLVPCINVFAAIWLFVSSAAVETYPDDPTQVQDTEAEREPLLSPTDDDFDEDAGEVSFADSTSGNPGPDLSASLHRELEDHGRRRAQQHLSVGRLSAPNPRVASIASSVKIVDPNEHTPLLIGGPEALYASVVEETASVRARLASRPPTLRGVAEAGGNPNVDLEAKSIPEGQVDWDFKSLGMNRGLWAFGTVMLLGMGPAEMVLSNIGSIANSLSTDHDDADNSLALRSHLVLLLSVSSTVARLVTGVLVDYLSPVSPLPGGVSRRRTIDRSVLAAGCLVVLSGALLWGALGVRSVKGLDLLSIGVGGMYGAVFTIT
jgi:hypothetical protein